MSESFTSEETSEDTSDNTREDNVAQGPAMARTLLFKVHDGMREAYEDYLRAVVEPIDEIARKAGAFETVQSFVPQTVTTWDMGRTFLYSGQAQFDAFAERMQRAAAQFDGDPVAASQRKSYATTLRERVDDVVITFTQPQAQMTVPGKETR